MNPVLNVEFKTFNGYTYYEAEIHRMEIQTKMMLGMGITSCQFEDDSWVQITEVKKEYAGSVRLTVGRKYKVVSIYYPSVGTQIDWTSAHFRQRGEIAIIDDNNWLCHVNINGFDVECQFCEPPAGIDIFRPIVPQTL